ncbi:TetR/AcrR family transcriptional regulator C-terminal domain-containing protein [Actinokineospora sp. NBRC 105648]|uniref:TetR/AcrR family transcriptional regulator C-terminal domain-containing protein n=1 Tax=Actinokineospora sp. NBRC 105648 TaxID=3032206 RepID=UPI0024A18D7E|nr:TetR/AcrR family transcriptional regulator C-terminal domain-containing protein [Actinokineospora sp. NBRC 105648]GLZ39267.1 TetR family transcriptional regulator [Actinokineospora sp. NBRC 105648]
MEEKPQRPGPKRSLSATRIVDAAMELFDGESPSIRGVAAHLGVRPNTLYTYLPDRAALERALVDRLLAEADPDLLLGRKGWRKRVEDYACALRGVLLGRRGAAALLHTAPMDGPTAALVGERLLAIFVAAGLAPDDAARATYVVIVHVLGSATLTAADLNGRGEEAVVAERMAIQMDAQYFPLTAATWPVVARWNTEDQFRWSLQVLLVGCAGSA